MRKKVRIQSAMEYLMTYGWAILIIAVVLGALFQLGVFGGTNFSPRFPPGSCRVVRLSGTINLEGVCSGLPQYAAQFNGQSSNINAGSQASLNIQSAITVSAWVKPNTLPTSDPTQQGIYARGTLLSFLLVSYVSGEVYALESHDGVGWNSYYQAQAGSLQIGTWTHIVATYDSSTGQTKVYINGNLAPASAQSVGSPLSIYSNAQTYIGARSDGYSFNGFIANVQIYNASLSASSIQAFYLEGIGGAPVQPQNLVGWWPLNGDANDYSGNGNNGASTNLVYTSSWINGYVPP